MKIHLFFLAAQLLCNPLFAKTLERLNDDNLTQGFARERKSQVQSVKYQVRLTFQKKAKEFQSNTVMDIDLAKTNQALSIDFLAQKIKFVKVNDREIKDFVVRRGSLDIPAKHLKAKTQIEIEATGRFSEEQSGIVKSVDPADGNEYIYTDFEPYYAHHVFPCFDQPDLKAKFSITVVAPADWKALSNEIIALTRSEGDLITTTFQPTQAISPYLVFIGAGPFSEWKDTLDGLPLLIHARRSIADSIDTANLFSITKRGLQFYSEYFGYPYPFSKYGQIFIPDFENEGMENPGAVTLDEGRIYRGQVSQAKIRERENLILHEMAHMWFGNLVTMSWWDDLWLNESFASYLAAVAQDKALKSENSWIDFFQFKSWGLWQDRLVTAHPIESKVPDVRTSKGNFDGITYAKGAAALKQLHFLAGDAEFRQGVKNYFNQFAFQNTTRQDFMTAVAKASKKDLKDWTKQWINTTGPNRISNQWKCADGKIKELSVSQTPNASKALLTHRLRVGLYSVTSATKIEKIEEQDVVITKEKTDVKTLIGEKCPEFVFTNVDDLDYGLHRLDEISLKNVKDFLINPDSDPLTRAMVWHSLAQRVRDSELSLTSYFNLALAALPQESNEAVLALLLGKSGQIKDFYFNYLTATQRSSLAPKLEAILFQRINNEKPLSNLQLSFFDFLIEVAITNETLLKFTTYLGGEDAPNGIKLDQDRRWSLLLAVSQRGLKDVEGLITLEENKDKTSRGQKNAYAARVSAPTVDAKKRLWNDLITPDRVSMPALRLASAAFNDPEHLELMKPYQTQFFQRVTSLNWKENDQWVDIYFQNLFPKSLCTPELLAESQKKLGSAKSLTPLARRAWMESNDELSNCLKVRRSDPSLSTYFF